MANSQKLSEKVLSEKELTELKELLWGKDIKQEIFRRWTQGFGFSDDEPTALTQLEGGPCAVIVPTQAFLLKHLLFDPQLESSDWRQLTGSDLKNALQVALIETFLQLDMTGRSFSVITMQADKITSENCGTSQQTETDESGQSSPKKSCFSDDQFHQSLRCHKCANQQELEQTIAQNISIFQEQYGVLLFLYSILLSKGLDQIKNEMEDPSEAMIDSVHGHGSQSMVNLLLTGKASSHVFDDEQDICGLLLHGIKQRSTIGFLTFLEHLRYLEVGWNLKNPKYPIWLLGSETHLTLIFSKDENLVSAESDEAKARRAFSHYDAEGSGFMPGERLGELMAQLDLEAEPEYVKIMQDKLDPEELGIVTLNSFLTEFYPIDLQNDTVCSHEIFHYNGLSRSHQDRKVKYAEGTALIKDTLETQFITDTSPMKYCMMTKWPTLELEWKSNQVPSLN